MKSNSEVYLGLDIGTTSVKAGLVAEDGTGIAQASCEYPTFFPGADCAEQDAEDWWKAACEAVRKLSGAHSAELKQVKAISISSQAPTLLPVDPEGRPLRKALIWMDQRAKTECAFLQEHYAEYIHQNMYNRINPYFALPKFLWFRSSEPGLYDRTFRILQANGWLIYKLTGQMTIDESSAALTQTLNVNTMQTDGALLKELGLDPDKWPRVCRCNAAAGTVAKEAAELWGVPEGIPVAAGCIDGASAPLGLGLTAPGDIYEMSGQSSGIGVIMDHPVYHPNLCLMRHAARNEWILKGSMSCSGGSLKWFRENVDAGKASFDDYSSLAEQSPAGANGLLFLPYLAGERAPLWDSSLRGLFFGIGTYTAKPDMVRAIMEGSAFALRTILDEFGEMAVHDKAILGTGGGYSSRIWSQIKSDILNAEISVSEQTFDAAITGNAVLAAQAAGSDMTIRRDRSADLCYKPDPGNRSLYERRYALYKRVFEANRQLFSEGRE